MVDPLNFENKVTILDRIIVRSYLTLLDNNEAFKRRLIINYNYFFFTDTIGLSFRNQLKDFDDLLDRVASLALCRLSIANSVTMRVFPRVASATANHHNVYRNT